jgi:hypothetical protein
MNHVSNAFPATADGTPAYLPVGGTRMRGTGVPPVCMLEVNTRA